MSNALTGLFSRRALCRPPILAAFAPIGLLALGCGNVDDASPTEAVVAGELSAGADSKTPGSESRGEVDQTTSENEEERSEEESTSAEEEEEPEMMGEPVTMTEDEDDGDSSSQPTDSEEMNSEEMNPEEMAPEEMNPEEMAPEEMNPEEMAPEEMLPEEMNPEEMMTPAEMNPEVPGGLCSTCNASDECNDGGACIRLSRRGPGFCGQSCSGAGDCPESFECFNVGRAGGQCVPSSGSCEGASTPAPDEGGMNPDEGGMNPDEGGMNPDEGVTNPDEGVMTPVPPEVQCDSLEDWDPEWAQFEQEVLAIVNERRAEGANCGGRMMAPVGPLTIAPLLTCAARGHSQDMAVRDFFDHDNPDGASPADRVDDTGYQWRNFGENIAYGQATPEAVMSGWMDSPGHCTNIMGADFTEIGIGYYLKDEPSSRRGGTPYWTQVFGRPR